MDEPKVEASFKERAGETALFPFLLSGLLCDLPSLEFGREVFIVSHVSSCVREDHRCVRRLRRDDRGKFNTRLAM
jgi:hypothetical protein